MTSKAIVLHNEGQIVRIVLNRPEKRNAINEELTWELLEALEEVRRDRQTRVLVLTGAGEAFCVGGGLEAGTTGPLRPSEQKPEELRQALRNGAQRVTLALREMDKPVIAMVNGVAAGGGFDWAMACDLRIGSEKTRFRVGFTSIGLFPGTGGAWLLPRIVGVPKAAEMLFTDRLVDSSEAERLGLLNKVVAHGDLEAETMKLAGQIASGPPIALRLAKMQLYRGLEMDLGTALEMAAACETITLTSEDHREGVNAFLEKRNAVFLDK